MVIALVQTLVAIGSFAVMEIPPKLEASTSLGQAVSAFKFQK